MLIGGCTGMEKSINDEETDMETKTELPDTPAAQDEYTRSLLVSTDEVADGHYVFKTWTEAYTMWIPIEATFSQTFYEKREDHFERFFYSWEKEEENITYLVYGLFEDRPDSEEVGLDHLSFYAKYTGDYTRSEDENNIYYYGEKVSEVGEEGDEKIPVYSHLGFIKHKNSGKSLGLQFKHNCSDWTTNCDADTQRIEDHFWALVKSVKFNE